MHNQVASDLMYEALKPSGKLGRGIKTAGSPNDNFVQPHSREDCNVSFFSPDVHSTFFRVFFFSVFLPVSLSFNPGFVSFFYFFFPRCGPNSFLHGTNVSLWF